MTESPDSTAKPHAARRLLYLDVIRAVAILLVIGRHLPESPMPAHAWGYGFFSLWHHVGWCGVDLFFALSGFLIGGMLIREYLKAGRIDIKRFYIRRAYRIWPSYFIFIFAAVAWIMVFGVKGDLAHRLSHGWETLWPNLIHLQNYVGPLRIVHTWTLAVEEHFYILIGAAILALPMLQRFTGATPQRLLAILVPGTFLLLLALCFYWRTDSTSWGIISYTHTRLDALFAGVCLAYFVNAFPDAIARLSRFRALLLPIGVAFFIPVYRLDLDTSHAVRTYGLSCTTLGSAVLTLWAYLASIAPQPALTGVRALLHRGALALGSIGTVSYSIYLWHEPFGRHSARILFKLMGMSVQPAWGYAVLMVIYTATSIGLGYLFYRLIETPFLRYRDRLQNKDAGRD